LGGKFPGEAETRNKRRYDSIGVALYATGGREKTKPMVPKKLERGGQKRGGGNRTGEKGDCKNTSCGGLRSTIKLSLGLGGKLKNIKNCKKG